MVEGLKAEGITDFQLLAITGWDAASDGPNWGDHAPGFEQASFPVMPDKTGVYYIYGADYYDAILIDKQGRLVHKEPFFAADKIEMMMSKVRKLDAE